MKREPLEATWGSDFFGTLNELPPEPVAGLAHVLEAMASFPPFLDARQWTLRHLGIAQESAILEGGCGNGGALAQLMQFIGTDGRIAGVDPTEAFITAARARAVRLGAANTHYEVGDIRRLPFDDDAFDAAFCDKVLIHAGPADAAIGELVRVTRPKGRVGAIEWLPFFALGATRPELADAFNGLLRKALYDYPVSANLARHFHRAGLTGVQTQAFLAHTASLDAHPFWRAFIVDQAPLFVHAGLIDESTSRELLADLAALNERGEFSASFIIQAAVGTKPG